MDAGWGWCSGARRHLRQPIDSCKHHRVLPLLLHAQPQVVVPHRLRAGNHGGGRRHAFWVGWRESALFMYSPLPEPLAAFHNRRLSRLFVPPQSGHRWHCLAARGSWLQVGRPPARAKAPGWCTRTAAARTADSAEDRAEELRQRAVHQRLTFTLPCADPWCPPRFRRFSDGRLRIRAAMTVANPSLACLPCSCPHPSCTPHPLRQPL